MSATVRPATLADAFAIKDLVRGLGLFPHIDAEPADAARERTAKHIAMCLAEPDSHSVLVAEKDSGQIAGYAVVHWLPYMIAMGPEGYVSDLFVAEDSRGQGLGSKLLEHIKEMARERGCVRLTLVNNRERESYARGFYAKQGFTERAEVACFVMYFG